MYSKKNSLWAKPDTVYDFNVMTGVPCVQNQCKAVYFKH